MVVNTATPGVEHVRVWLDGQLIGGVVQADDEAGWVDVHPVREVAGRRTYTSDVERAYGFVAFVAPRSDRPT